MADNYTALKSSQKKRYISKDTFNSLDLTQIPVGSEYDIVGPIDKGDLSAEINNSLNKADNALANPTNQTTGSNGDVLVKTASGSEWQSISTPTVVQTTGQSTSDVMSQKATTDSLNLLEAKLNENIAKDPSKTYAIIKGSECYIENGSSLSSGSIDFGDGTIVNFPTPDFEFTHTYIDGVDMHIVSVSGVTQLPSVLFANHVGPIKVITGDNVTRIGGGICNGCTNLEEFVIGKNVTDIVSLQIIGSSGIKILISKAVTPPTCINSDITVPNLEKIIVPKSAISAYKAATGWSTYADKIVYEVDSSDLPDTSNYVDLNSSQTITGQKQFANAVFIGEPKSYTGYKVGNPSASSTTTYENGYIDFKNKDNSHKGSIKIPSVDDDLNTFALLKDIPDTSNLSSFSVEVW